jgi:GST-like protein
MRTLYTVPTANGQRASIALEECELEYDTRSVNLFDGEHRNKEMLALNPFGRMPVLQHGDGETTYGSMAIGMYAARESGRLLPSAADENAFHHWAGVIMTDLAPAFAGQFYLGTLAPEKFPWGIEFYGEIIQRFLAGIDAHLSDNEYFLDGGYSLVDVLMYPTAATSVPRIPGGLEPYSNIARWAAAIGERRAVRQGIDASS